MPSPSGYPVKPVGPLCGIFVFVVKTDQQAMNRIPFNSQKTKMVIKSPPSTEPSMAAIKGENKTVKAPPDDEWSRR